ncbi:hypothetical protein QJS10_CPA05g00603 [Acorus calamus]|uniref:Uncharacterized protein n=1 Tax=Acorus calamus TaxID=4465 RepID=A0AAV9EWN1_ACOCL|nr:hypothetical protein QJS10_CPA05g00603 [Acorus calamus]
MFITPSKLRALHFQYCPIRELPDSISNMKHLRYICLSGASFKALPQSIGSLRSLQILTISSCRNLATLPASLGGLLNLQILAIFNCSNLATLPASLGGLLNLQVLVVNRCYQFESMPSSIGDLRNLNVLRIIECSKLQILPESMMKLQKLDCLDLHLINLRELPSGMSNMTNLRNLENSDCYRFTHMPKEMKKLNKLQKLPRFVVDEERGSSIAELRHLQLEGELKILSLGKLKDPSAARAANLKEKGGLRRLHLFKGSSKDESLDDVAVAVLEGLEPPQNICELRMSGGTEFPRWLNMGESSYPKLDYISLFHFSRCKHLPPLGQLQLLKTLDIYGMSLIEVVGREFCGDNGDDVAFPSLDKITFGKMPTWKKWLISEEEDGITRQQSMAFTSLTQLQISDCPELTSLPSLPSLRELHISWCPELASLPSLPSLRELHISWCPELTSLHSLPSLQELTVNSSMKLLKAAGSLRGVGSLKRLKILGSGEEVGVMNGPQDLSSVEELEIIQIGELACVMESMHISYPPFRNCVFIPMQLRYCLKR